MGAIGDDRRAELVESIGEKCRMLNLIDVTRDILLAAGRPLPVVLSTLDAIHLATAMSISLAHEESLLVITHDRQLAAAARRMGFDVMGDE
jgi:predicted nucleic acid-binding protein